MLLNQTALFWCAKDLVRIKKSVLPAVSLIVPIGPDHQIKSQRLIPQLPEKSHELRGAINVVSGIMVARINKGLLQ